MGTNYPSSQVPPITIPGYPTLTRIRGGCIRLGVGGPDLWISGDHDAVGITGVRRDTATGDLIVEFDYRFDDVNEHLLIANADPDLTLALKKINCGISRGGYDAQVRFVRQDTGGVVACNSSYFDITQDNIWIKTICITPVAATP